MANYNFTTDQGWRVTEYRPFSPSYAVLHTPGLREYAEQQGLGRPEKAPCSTADGIGRFASSDNLLQKLTGQQLKFDYFSVDVLRQLLEERVAIRDRNRSSILGRLTDVSGDIYCASQLHTPDSEKRKQGLEKTKLDLERELRETDERLWKDTAEVRERLIIAARKHDSTQLRSEMVSPFLTYYANNKESRYSVFPG